MVEIRIYADAGELFKAAAGEFLRLAEEAVRSKGLFTVCLSGGSTPRRLYSLLGDEPEWKHRIPWGAAHFFWSDERRVPPDEPESNFRMAWETMLSKVPVPAANIHRIPGELPDADRAAHEYDGMLRGFFKLGEERLPRFDLALLGMGADGHTASLFPESAALHEERRMVVSNWIERLATERITMTAPVLNNASHVIFLVLGEEKAPALKAVLQGPRQPDRLPAQVIQPADGSLLWLVDRHAAHLLGL